MIYLFIVVSTIASCFLFEKITLTLTVRALVNSYKEQYLVFVDKSIDDDTKQKYLLKQTMFQVKKIALLVIQLLIVISPFVILVITDQYIYKIEAQKLYSTIGILLSFIVVLCYIPLRKYYVKLFNN